MKESSVPIGIWGLIKRDGLEDVDVGFAFLPQFRTKGYAYESASAIMVYGKDVLKLERIVAVTSPENHNAARLLEKLGLRFRQMVTLGTGGAEMKLFG